MLYTVFACSSVRRGSPRGTEDPTPWTHARRRYNTLCY